MSRNGGRQEPNTRATTVELFDGLEATSQNHWPSLEFDVGVVNNYVARFLPARFAATAGEVRVAVHQPGNHHAAFEIDLGHAERGGQRIERRAHPQDLLAADEQVHLPPRFGSEYSRIA